MSFLYAVMISTSNPLNYTEVSTTWHFFGLVDLPVVSTTPLPNTAMYAELPAQTFHSMREWAEATEEMVTFFSFLSTHMLFPINMGKDIYS